MNTQKVAIFFCALLCSSFAHDWSNGQRSLLETKAKKTTTTKSADTALSSGSNPVSYICLPSNPNVIAIINLSINVVVIIDLINNIAFCLDGNAVVGVLIDLGLNTGYYVTNGAWNAAHLDFKAYLATVNLVALKTIPQTISINIYAAAQNVLDLCVHVLGNLGDDLFIQVNANVLGSLSIFISLCINIRTNIVIKLTGLLNLVATDYVVIKGGLLAFVSCITGLVTLLLNATVTVTVLVSQGVLIAIKACLEAADGLSVMAYVLAQIGAHFDLSVILIAVVNSPQLFLEICIALGGNILVGVNGVFCIVAKVLAYINGTITLNACIELILRVCAKANVSVSVSACLNAIQLVLNTQISIWHNSIGLSVLINFIAALNAGTCVIASVNISAIISLCAAGVVTTILDLVVLILLCLNVLIDVKLICASLLYVCLTLLSTIDGRILLNICIPNLNIVINYNYLCLNLLLNTIYTLLSILIIATVSIVQALLAIPSTNIIFNTLDAAIQAKAGLLLSDCVNNPVSYTIYAAIYVWIQLITNLGC